MKKIILVAMTVLLILTAGCGSSDQQALLDQVEKTPIAKFQDQKFGMFIHWGLYAIPAGVWKGEYVRGIGEWIMFRKQIPVQEYEKLADEFNPVDFNADEWSQLAEDAGMKYMVITSKHHDGFAMYGSEVSDYNIVDRTPFKRDPMKELAEANAARGISFGFYYSQAQDWHEPNAAGNTWDFPEERDPQPYVTGKALPQVEEILSGYGPLGLIWFDTPRLLTEEQARGLKAKVKELQPDCLVNNRIGFDLGDYYQMGDNAIPVMVYDAKAWEVPATLNDTWGFKTNDNNWKNPRDLIYKLTDIVSKGGNYLLNVGPTADGVIPKPSQDILRAIGAWMSVNGESIYGTTHTPFFYPGITWKCTAKPGNLFFHILNWPGETLRIEGLESKATGAVFLANGESVEFIQEGNQVTFALPAEPVDEFNTVIALDIEDETPVITEGFGYRDSRETMTFYSLDARLRGEELRYDWENHSVTGFSEAESFKNELYWYFYPYEDAVYDVEFEYACGESSAGKDIYFSNSVGEAARFTTAAENTGGGFKTCSLGRISAVAGGERNLLILGVSGDDKDTDLQARKIVLKRIYEEENK